jgi:PAS domain S-box-containing protein
VKTFDPENPPAHVREARLRTLLSLATTPMIVTDGDRRFLDANEMACAVLGVSREELLTRRLDDFTAGEGGFDVERFWQLFLEEGRVNGSYPVKRLDGQVRAVVYAATAKVVPGRHMGIFSPGGNGAAVVEPVARNGRSKLTPREREILQMIADGLTDREIAGRLTLSPATARTHARNLIGKLGAHTRAQAVAVAIRHGEITL